MEFCMWEWTGKTWRKISGPDSCADSEENHPSFTPADKHPQEQITARTNCENQELLGLRLGGQEIDIPNRPAPEDE